MVRIQNSNQPNYSGTTELVATENGLIGYTTSIVDKLYRKLHIDAGKSVLEFGAGTGFLAEIFRDKHEVTPTCVELDPNLCSLIREKNFKTFQYLKDAPTNFDAIYTSNVLEHIEDDISALKEIRLHLKSEGRIGIYVPAHPILFSKMDETVGHVRRYRKSELVEKVKKAGFEVKSVQYDDFIGFFASLAVKFLGYGKSGIGSAKSLQIYDWMIYPISKILDIFGFRYILGKNILLIAANNNSQTGIPKNPIGSQQ